jgi:hypothetical protein
MASKAVIKTRMDLVKEEILRQAQEWGGNQWFSSTETRHKILLKVDGITPNTLNYYIRVFKANGFLNGDHENGRGWSYINPSK